MLITLETHTAVPQYGMKPLSSPADQETTASKGIPRPSKAVSLYSVTYRHLVGVGSSLIQYPKHKSGEMIS